MGTQNVWHPNTAQQRVNAKGKMVVTPVEIDVSSSRFYEASNRRVDSAGELAPSVRRGTGSQSRWDGGHIPPPGGGPSLSTSEPTSSELVSL